MGLDKNKIRTQDEVGERAPIDQVEERVEAKMKQIEGDAKQSVAHGLQDAQLEEEAQRLKREADQELDESNSARAKEGGG